jgi:hypothetical protein
MANETISHRNLEVTTLGSPEIEPFMRYYLNRDDDRLLQELMIFNGLDPNRMYNLRLFDIINRLSDIDSNNSGIKPKKIGEFARKSSVQIGKIGQSAFMFKMQERYGLEVPVVYKILTNTDIDIKQAWPKLEAPAANISGCGEQWPIPYIQIPDTRYLIANDCDIQFINFHQ